MCPKCGRLNLGSWFDLCWDLGLIPECGWFSRLVPDLNLGSRLVVNLGSPYLFWDLGLRLLFLAGPVRWAFLLGLLLFFIYLALLGLVVSSYSGYLNLSAIKGDSI